MTKYDGEDRPIFSNNFPKKSFNKILKEEPGSFFDQKPAIARRDLAETTYSVGDLLFSHVRRRTVK